MAHERCWDLLEGRAAQQQVPGQTPTWQTGSRVYDPATKRVYVHLSLPSSHPRFTLTKDGRERISLGASGSRPGGADLAAPRLGS